MGDSDVSPASDQPSGVPSDVQIGVQIPAAVECAETLELRSIPGLPVFRPGDDLPALLVEALRRADIVLRHGDAIVMSSKAVSRAEGRFVDLATVTVSERAAVVARATGKDPRLVEMILREGPTISRQMRGVLVVRHRLGFVTAHASIDQSNATPPDAPTGTGPWILLLPQDPDASAERIRVALESATGARIGVVVSDSLGRPFRLGTVGAAVGLAGMPALFDQRGRVDLFGRRLEITVTALADQVAAAADLVAGQAAEGRAAVLVRGLHFSVGEHRAAELYRNPGEDLYA